MIDSVIYKANFFATEKKNLSIMRISIDSYLFYIKTKIELLLSFPLKMLIFLRKTLYILIHAILTYFLSQFSNLIDLVDVRYLYSCN